MEDEKELNGAAVCHYNIVGNQLGAILETAAYTVVQVTPKKTTCELGETMAHELCHVIAVLIDDKTNPDRLIYNDGPRRAANLLTNQAWWLRHPPVGGVDNPPPANKSRFFVAEQ